MTGLPVRPAASVRDGCHWTFWKRESSRVQQESLRRKTLFALFSQTKTVSLTESLQHQTAHDTKLFCFVFLNLAKTTKIMKLRFIICHFVLGLVVFSQADLRQLFLGRLFPSLVDMDKLGSNDH